MATSKARSSASLPRCEFSVGNRQRISLVDQPHSDEPVKYCYPSLIEAIIDSNRAYEIEQIVKSAQLQANAGSKKEPEQSSQRPFHKVTSLEEARLKRERAIDRYLAKFETTAQKVLSHSSMTREEKIKWFEWHIEHQYNLSEAYHDKGPYYKARVAARTEEMLLHKYKELLQ